MLGLDQIQLEVVHNSIIEKKIEKGGYLKSPLVFVQMSIRILPQRIEKLLE